ncbi:MAG: YdeI/OmpD-associated family protein, partial [Terriglobales bacterium]
IAKWVSEPQSDAARARRVEQIAERLLAVMDAECELPPILQVAFARNPQARAGWEKMSPAKRRSHLFGIFYYRTPEGRTRRIEKMMDEAFRKIE